MKAILLAAGFATRLYPLTRDQAKPLLRVGGKAILSHLLDRMQSIRDLSEVVVVGNQRFHDDLVAWASAEKRPWPIQVLNDGVQNDHSNLGALRDLKLATDWLQDRAIPIEDCCLGAIGARTAADREGLLVAAGDNLIDFDLGPYAEMFRRNRAPLLLLRRIPPPIPAARYNEVEVDGSGKVTRFREKPRDPQSDLASICLYFFPQGIDQDLGRYLEGGGNDDAPGYFLEWLVGQRQVHGCALKGGWFDIGNAETLAAARAAYEEGKHAGKD